MGREREGVEKFRAGLDHLHIVGIQEQEKPGICIDYRAERSRSSQLFHI